MRKWKQSSSSAGQLRGFTLLELIIVMVVLAIIAAITVPSLRGFLTGSSARDASTQILSLASYARAKAASDSTTYRLNFDLAGNTYWLTVQNNGGNGFSDLGTEFGEHFELPVGMQIQITPITADSNGNPLPPPQVNSAIDFRPDGSSDAVIVKMIDADGKVQYVAAPSTGETYRLMSEEEVAKL